ncbi:MAG: phage tail family protein [Clostridia bacterium]|nr:phage tail family protein [Clostridia bacterium]
MKKIICENYKNNKITFTYDFPFFITSTDGLYEIKGNVATVSSAYGIGESYAGTSVKKRNIIINGIIADNFVKRRDTLYNMFPLDTTGTLYYYEDDIARKIEYKVEDVDVAEKGVPRTFTISLICPYPYFKDIEESEASMSTWTPKFCFPMISEQGEGIEFATKNITTMGTIINDTNIEFGVTIKFIANGRVVNPYLINVNTQEQIAIDIEMEAGDQIIITTHRNNKNVIYISTSTNEAENINYKMKFGSKFLQMHSGDNTLRAGAEEGEESLETKVFYSIEYGAV